MRSARFHECTPGRRKLAVKVVDIFGNDTMTIVEVTVKAKDNSRRDAKTQRKERKAARAAKSQARALGRSEERSKRVPPCDLLFLLFDLPLRLRPDLEEPPQDGK